MSGSRRQGAAPEFTARVLPEVAQPTGAGPAMAAAQQIDSIGDRILRLAERQGQRADAAAQEDAFTAGLSAGDAEPGVQMEGGGDLFRRAYNRAALESGSRRMEITARGELDRMGRNNQANPQGFDQDFAAWRNGALEGLPEAFRARVGPVLDAMAGPYRNAIQDQNDRSVADEAGASFIAALPGRMGAIERLGLRAATDPAAAAELDREQANLRRDLVRMGPRSAFTLNGVEYPADATRSGRYTLEQVAEISGRARDAEIVAVARGGFASRPQTLQAVEEWEQQALRGEVHPDLRPDQVRSVAAALRRDISHARTAMTEGQREARIALQPRLERDRLAIAERGEPVSGILNHELSAAGINVQEYRAQEQARMAGWQAQQDLQNANTPQRAQEIADRFAIGSDLERADPATAARVRNLMRERGAHIAGEALRETVRDRAAELSANASRAAGPFSMDRAVQMLERTESGGRANIGDHDGAGPGTASGLLGITAGMWQSWAARAGVADRDRNDPEAQRRVARVFLEAQDAWAKQTLGRGLTYADVRGAWFLGEAGWRAMVQAPAGADAFEIYSRAAGPERAAQAFDNPRNRAVLQRGRTAGDVMAALAAQAGEGAWRQDWNPGPIVTDEERRQAGWTPEQAARLSHDAMEAAREAAMRVRVLTGTPEERQQIETALATIGGERAAENARLSVAYREVMNARDTAIAQDPAGFAVQVSPALQGLQQRVAQGDVSALPALLDGVRQEQTRQGVPEAQQRPISAGLAQALVQSITSLPTDAERLPALRRILGQVRTDQQQDMLAGLRMARLPEPVAVAAAVAPRVGEAGAARLLSELQTDVSKLGLTPEMTRTVRENTAGLMDDSDRLGGVRAAQYAATRNADFIERSAASAARLRQVVSVRAAPRSDAGSSVVRGAYDDLYGSHVAMDRAGVLAMVPRDIDQAALARGLAAIRDRAAQALAPGDTPAARALRADFRRGRWMDVGDGRFSYFPQYSPIAHAGQDGAPMVVTAAEALNLSMGGPTIGAPQPEAAAAAPRRDLSQPGMIDRARRRAEIDQRSRDFVQPPRTGPQVPMSQ